MGMPTLWAMTALFALPLAVFGKTGSVPGHYSQIRFPDWTYTLPDPAQYRVDLEGGVPAYLVPDSTLDLLKVQVYSGEPNQPGKPQESAAYNLYSGLLKAGGAGSLSPDQLEDSLEFVAAEMSAGLQDWQGMISLDCLAGNGAELMALLPDLVLKPRLDSAVFRLQQRAMVENLKHRYDTPRGVIQVAYERVMQGSHPSNWMPKEEEVLALTPQALSSLSGRGFPSGRMVLAVAGRFDRQDMVNRLNALVKRFPKGKGKGKETARPFRGPKPPGVYIVDKPFAQASIRISAPGVQRPHPDYYRLTVASYIFGDGGFTSRLVKKVRSDEGLAYGVSSDVESDYYRKGSVSVSLQTKVETGAFAIRLVLDEMQAMVKTGIKDEELEKAKDGLLKSLPSMFESPGAMARVFAQGELWGRKSDHFANYEKTIKAMTKAEVEDAFRRYFIPDSMRIVVVGPKAALAAKDKQGFSLESFGKVTEITTGELDSRE